MLPVGAAEGQAVTLDILVNDVEAYLDDKGNLINNDQVKIGDTPVPVDQSHDRVLRYYATGGTLEDWELSGRGHMTTDEQLSSVKYPFGEDYSIDMLVGLSDGYVISNLGDYEHTLKGRGLWEIKLRFTNNVPTEPKNCWGSDVFKPTKPKQEGYSITIPDEDPWYEFGVYELSFPDYSTPDYPMFHILRDMEFSETFTLEPGYDVAICQNPSRSDRGDEFRDYSGSIERLGRACWLYSRPWPADYNKFGLPYGKLNTKKATASLSFKVRTSGSVKLSGVGIKTQVKTVYSSGRVTLVVQPDSKTLKSMKKKLKKRRSVSRLVRVKATYTADRTHSLVSEGKPYTVYKTYKLTLKRKR